MLSDMHFRNLRQKMLLLQRTEEAAKKLEVGPAEPCFAMLAANLSFSICYVVLAACFKLLIVCQHFVRCFASGCHVSSSNDFSAEQELLQRKYQSVQGFIWSFSPFPHLTHPFPLPSGSCSFLPADEVVLSFTGYGNVVHSLVWLLH